VKAVASKLAELVPREVWAQTERWTEEELTKLREIMKKGLIKGPGGSKKTTHTKMKQLPADEKDEDVKDKDQIFSSEYSYTEEVKEDKISVPEMQKKFFPKRSCVSIRCQIQKIRKKLLKEG
jgi:hypothetical protein